MNALTICGVWSLMENDMAIRACRMAASLLSVL